MGWTETNGNFPGMKKWLSENFTETERTEIIDYALVHRTDGWILFKDKQTGAVTACAVLINNLKHSYFTKEIPEMGGPCITSIPEKLFNQLTPLDESNPDYTYAIGWRKKVRDNLERINRNKSAYVNGTNFKYAGYEYSIINVNYSKTECIVLNKLTGQSLRMKRVWFFKGAEII